MAWRNCVSNYTKTDKPSNQTICDSCNKQFDVLFDYYWKIYKEPNIDFCLDVETTVSSIYIYSHGFIYVLYICLDE